jgi:hypothetical protein
MIENLLRVNRRDAIRLLHRFGGYQAGRTFLVGRDDLIAQLEEISKSDGYDREARRRTRLADELARTRRDLAARRVVIPTTAGIQERRVSDLPAGIQLRPGRLEIDFGGTEDLLRLLMELAQAIANDYSTFREALGEPLSPA